VSDHVCRDIIERAVAVLAVAAALAVAGCSAETGFPSVHDMPAPRADTTLTPDEVKAATDSLISQRDQLQTNAQSVAPASVAPVQAAEASPPATTAKAKKKKPAVAAAKPAPAPTDDATGATDTGATDIGAYAKP
jgi:hypothetical protein